MHQDGDEECSLKLLLGTAGGEQLQPRLLSSAGKQRQSNLTASSALICIAEYSGLSSAWQLSTEEEPSWQMFAFLLEEAGKDQTVHKVGVSLTGLALHLGLFRVFQFTGLTDQPTV